MKTKAILLMVFFLGWVTTGWAADHVKGDGKLTSKKISVADYNEIKVDGVIDFNYEPVSYTHLYSTYPAP